MSDTQQTADRTGPPALQAQRVGSRTFLARNDRGAEVLVGPDDVEGTFTPGELLALALAVCSGMSADHRLAHHLGPDYEAVLGVTRTPVPDENRYAGFDVDIAVDMSALDPDARRTMLERAARAAQRGCTVGRTVRAGADYSLTFTDRSGA